MFLPIKFCAIIHLSVFQFAVFEPGTRNTGTAIAGKNIANPISMMNSAADLLEHLQLENHSVWLREAIDKTINVDKIHTPGKGLGV